MVRQKHADIGDIIGMRYRMQTAIKPLAMPSNVKKEILDAIADIHMPFYLWANKPAPEAWDAYKTKVLVRIEHICTDNDVHRAMIERIKDRVKMLQR